jgi:RNA polymerase sigma-70 factor (ECF subfamily)
MSSPGPGQSDGELIAMLESCREALTRFAIWLARDRSVAEDIVDIDTYSESEEAQVFQHDDDPRMSDLRRAILSLPDDYRVPLVMQILGGFTTAEIASELNLSVTAVLTRLFRARNRLRELCGTAPPDTDMTAGE